MGDQMRVGALPGSRMMRFRASWLKTLTVIALSLIWAIALPRSSWAVPAYNVSGSDFSQTVNYGDVPASVQYTLDNETGATIYFPVTPSGTFFDISNAPSSLANGQQAVITITIHSGLDAGSYSGAVDFGNAARLDLGLIAARNITINVTGTNQTISFTTNAPAAIVAGPTYTPAASATSGKTVTLGASGACSMSGGVVHMLAVGNCTVTGDQAGGQQYYAAPQVTQVFNVGKGNLNASLQTSGSPSESGASVTFTASFLRGDNAATLPNGTVSFASNGTTIGSASLSISGTAQLSIASLNTGDRSIVATYSGNGNYNGAASAPITQTVNKGGTTLALMATPATAGINQPVTLKATVAKIAPALGVVSGTVVFKKGITNIGSAEISGGKATLVTSSLGMIGTTMVKAVYNGSQYLSSSQNTTAVTISPATGDEKQVNTTTEGAQQFPAVAALKFGGHVIAWASDGEDGFGYGVYAQRYQANGAKAGLQLKVHTYKPGDQTLPTVSGLDDGRFIVAWQSKGQDGSAFGIYAQIFAANGVKSGAAFQVNTTTANDQTLPSVAGLPGGGFIISWTSKGQDGSGLGVYAQRYNASDQPAGAEFRVNTAAAGDQSASRVIPRANGAFVIAWQSFEGAGLGNGIYAQRFNVAGAKLGTPVHVNTVTAGDQSAPAGTLLSDGGYLIAWQSDGQDGSGYGVFGQRYDAAGNLDGPNFRANTFTAGDQSQPSVSGFSDGGFVMTWTSAGQDGSGQGIFAQVFDVNGVKVNSEFPVNATTLNNQTQSAVAAFASGNFVAVWTSFDDATAENIEMQRFVVPIGP